MRPALRVLLGAVCTLLLIACTNTASLMVAKAADRRRELAVRAAIGASRSRLVRQLFAESLLLSLLAGGLALALAAWLINILRALNPNSVPRLDQVTLDAHSLLFALSVCTLAGILAGTLPALQSSRPDLHSALKEGDPGQGWRRNRGRSILVASEIALSLILLVGAGLLLKSFVRLISQPLGFDPAHVLSVAIMLPQAKYSDASTQASFFDHLLERVQRVQMVQSAALVNIPPLMPGWDMTAWAPAKTGGRQLGSLPPADLQVITPDYFRVLRIRLVKGRFFSGRDTRGALSVAIINEAMARQYWPDTNPISRPIRVDWRGASSLCTIVGIVDDTRYADPQRAAQPEIYLSFCQFPIPVMHLLVRTVGDPSKLANLLRQEARAIDKDQPISDPTTLEERLSASVASPRFHSFLLGTFATLGLILALVGMYGLTSYVVVQRTHEIGVRIALGAGRKDVLRLAGGEGLIVLLSGASVGITGALGLTRFLASMLYDVKPTDASTLGAITLLLTVVALLANLLPAYRATRVDPMVALRYE